MVYSVQEYKFGLGSQEDALCMILTKSHINSQSKLHSTLRILSLSLPWPQGIEALKVLWISTIYNTYLTPLLFASENTCN